MQQKNIVCRRGKFLWMLQWYLCRVFPVVCLPIQHNKNVVCLWFIIWDDDWSWHCRNISVSFSDSLSDISITNLVAPPILSFFLVLRMPAFGFFILPFGVAGNGARYLRMRFGLLMHGMPINWLLSAASVRILRGALKNDWCMYFSWLCLYGSVYKDLFAACKVDCYLNIVVHMLNASRWWPFWLCVGFVVGFIGSFHNTVFVYLPPDNTKFPL